MCDISIMFHVLTMTHTYALSSQRTANLHTCKLLWVNRPGQPPKKLSRKGSEQLAVNWYPTLLGESPEQRQEGKILSVHAVSLGNKAKLQHVFIWTLTLECHGFEVYGSIYV